MPPPVSIYPAMRRRLHCQGATQHYADGVTGVNSFDVYAFFAQHPTTRSYAKRIKSSDFGDAEFDQSMDIRIS
jgi:hypothetical protein